MSSGNGYSILIIDDEEGIRFGLTNLFEKAGFRVFAYGDFDRAVSTVREENIDIAILDIRLKDKRSGIDLLRELKRIEPDIIVIIITGYGSIDTAITSMKEGASDYIIKPIDNAKLLDIVNKNLQIRNLRNENYYLKNELLSRSTSYKFVTRNSELQAVLKKADKIKNSPVTVLIMGESGTGKEVLARYIHFTSNRRQKEFVSINCAALSESLLLSELFGHEKGAFTGAVERKTGKFEIANGGTLFLDEIGDMSLEVQAKLLRVLEESSFERVGGTKRISVDVRIIAATNKDLKSLIDEGLFREDLYYRINVVSFNLIPLRERREDIALLIDYFLEKYNKKYRKHVKGFDKETMQLFMSYKWPGNVRELDNIVNQAVLLAEEEVINLKGLKKYFLSEDSVGVTSTFDIGGISSLKAYINGVIAEYEKRVIEYFLNKNSFNKSKTARELGLTRKSLLLKIKKYNIK